MRKPDPILIIDLFPPTREALLGLLESLSPNDWERPTSCSQWSVKDVALHLLGDDVGMLSRRRDQFNMPGVKPPQNWAELVALINELNDAWVRAARRISPRLLIDLLRFTGPQVEAFFASLDPHAIGAPVDWASSAPAPNWLDLAREYTERWHHQQQIRDAVARPGLMEPRFFAPVLDAFVRALPHTFRNVAAPDAAVVQLTISGDSGGTWLLRRENSMWNLYAAHSADSSLSPAAIVTLGQDDAWRLFTKGLSRDAARPRATLRGNITLAEKVLDTISVIG